MVLEPNEVCKFQDTCEHVGSGEFKCYGTREDRDTYFTCYEISNKKYQELKKDYIKTT